MEAEYAIVPVKDILNIKDKFKYYRNHIRNIDRLTKHIVQWCGNESHERICTCHCYTYCHLCYIIIIIMIMIMIIIIVIIIIIIVRGEFLSLYIYLWLAPSYPLYLFIEFLSFQRNVSTGPFFAVSLSILFNRWIRKWWCK